MKKTILYVYAMTNDNGFAPSISDTLLTLACCKGGKKGGMRRNAAENIQLGNDVWVMGLCGKRLAGNRIERVYKPVFLAQIGDVLEMKDYYSNKVDFNHQKDHKAYSEKIEAVPEHNPHSKDDIEKDKGGKYVLLSRRFVYWGDACGTSGLEIETRFPRIFHTDLNNPNENKGIDKHNRGYLVDRDFSEFSEFIEQCQWFPKGNKNKIISRIGISGDTYVYDNDENSEKVMRTCFSCR